MEVRVALAADCRAIAEAHVASWQAAYAGLLPADYLASLSIQDREQMWSEALSRRRCEVFVACSNSEVVGFVALARSRDVNAPPGRGELWALYVHPRRWNTGAGRGLWSKAREVLSTYGFSSVSVWVLEKNERALSFYTSAGFRREPGAEKHSELGGVMLTEVRMVHAS